jgi:hypothetical protein
MSLPERRNIGSILGYSNGRYRRAALVLNIYATELLATPERFLLAMAAVVALTGWFAGRDIE